VVSRDEGSIRRKCLDINDTIAGIATAAGEGGIAIIRVSGPGAAILSKALFVSKEAKEGGVEFKARHLYYGELKAPGSRVVIDNANCVYIPGPNSYTGEDVVEFHCHGGKLIVKNVLAAVLANGARLAEPGEFTRQAFVNGKMDLAQAEAVLDIIRAGTDTALSAARGRLEGRLSAKLKVLREAVFSMLARIEAELDFSEDEIDKLVAKEFLSVITGVEAELKALLNTYGEGSALRDGVKVAIIGRPNVGKSSLLNLLLKEERAIVTSEPGTTRDVIEEVVNIRGLPIRLVDTAGLRKTSDKAESIGVERAKERAVEARLVLFVIDSFDQNSFKNDLEILDTIARQMIIVANKSDLIGRREREDIRAFFEERKDRERERYGPVFISALDEVGLGALEDTIFEAVTGRAQAAGEGFVDGGGSVAYDALGETITSARHKAALEQALKGIERSIEAHRDAMPMEIIASELRAALDSIGLVTGETTTEDILERIFSEFCIGK
jgi:tRNA modification GTPase